MPGHLNYQHAQYAFRTEQEHNRVQAKNELNRYYDHWGKVNSRYQNWTNQEYYESADKRRQSQKQLVEKESTLEQRRAKLRELFANEADTYDSELGRQRRPRTGDRVRDLETLNRLNETLKERENLKRKLELEAKLYGRWRHGVDDEKLLYKSKSDHQVLAKLNWLDQQIEEQRQREQQKAQEAEQQLLLQQEINRTEQAQKERQLIREQEIKEIRALQEKHMAELKERQEETEKLKDEEKHFRVFIEELKKEQLLLEESTAFALKRSDLSHAFNLNKIKVLLRSRSEANRKQIGLCMDLINRIKGYATKRNRVETLLTKLRAQQDSEMLASSQIECMYESEAKYLLQRCEDDWRDQNLQRYDDIKQLVESEETALSTLLQENVKQQEEIVQLRTTHLEGLEQTNKQLEQLNNEAKQSPRVPIEEIPIVAATPLPELRPIAETPSEDRVPKITNSFSNLNLDCWQDLPPVRGGIDSPRLQKTRSMNVVNPNNVVPPKFARKRVAWT